jgi:hypothetical protein
MNNNFTNNSTSSSSSSSLFDINNINACSACSTRYGIDSPSAVNNCCYQTCSSFIDGSQDDVINSNCGQKCQSKCVSRINLKPPVIHIKKNDYKECLINNNGDTKNALGCCMKNCKSNECQEQCIDAYNALLPLPLNESIYESFVYPTKKNHKYLHFLRDIIFLICVILLHILLIKIIKAKSELSQNPLITILLATFLYVILYYCVTNIISICLFLKDNINI